MEGLWHRAVALERVSPSRIHYQEDPSLTNRQPNYPLFLSPHHFPFM
jgi:hypothetical protein